MNAVNQSGSVPTMRDHAEGRGYRLAIVISHPIQYFSPWFASIAALRCVVLRVFYLWDFGVEERYDRDFEEAFRWDIPLLQGYESEFLANESSDPGTHWVGGLDNPSAVDRLTAFSPDAVLLFGYTYKTFLRILFSRRLRGIPFILRGDSHDLAGRNSFTDQMKRRIRGWLFRRFAAFSAVGSANAEYLMASDVPPEKIFFAPHCVDNERFQKAAPGALSAAAEWKEVLGIPADALVVLFAGKLEERKRPQDVLTAFLRMSAHANHPAARPVLLFVGSGETEPELRRLAGESIGRDVFFVPFQNQTKMPAVYAMGDVLVLPSSSETWGLAVNEAMNVGLPAIVSSHVGCGPDLIIQGETGWVFPAGDVDALAATLATALDDRERLAKMGEAARLRVAGYSYSAATDGLMAAIKAVVSQSSSPGVAI